MDTKKGIESAEISEKNKKEIDTVFDELNKQLSEETEGKIAIDRFSFSRKPNTLDKIADKIVAGLTYEIIKPSRDVIEFEGLGAFRKDAQEESAILLTEWSQGKFGYPCKITLGHSVINCEDKEGLEHGLIKVLEDPNIGEILFKLSQKEINLLEDAD